MTPPRKPIKRRLSYDRKLLLFALMTGAPGVAVSLILLWVGDFTPKVQWTLTTLIAGFWLGFAYSLRHRVVVPLQTLANILAALRESDFSLRARGGKRDDSLGEVMLEVNELAETLREQRLGAMEATTLLRKVMAEIDAAVFTFDGDQKLRLVNRAGERLLAQPSERLMGRGAVELGLSGCLAEEGPLVIDVAFPGSSGRWEVRRSAFRQGGLPMQMVVLTDLSRALRQEERQAWQRLIRVLGHELNNSLAPIRSIAGSLADLLGRAPRPSDWEEDTRRGLAVIASRSESLSRFMDAYARLARLPQPKLQPLDIGVLLRRVAGLETRLGVQLAPGPGVTIQADGDQIEQLLINLVRNAADAALETGGGVRVGWKKNATHVDLFVQDEGPGLSNITNLFVPFFTTKPGGSGIGLVLSRQIAEAHGGALTVENRKDRSGCEALLRLPL
ncbi:MAG TPA: ATP-binding protein [Patescibacteria group bacterium]|nr:ATP-binding protein [Patescibacteria group bacterium]